MSLPNVVTQAIIPKRLQLCSLIRSGAKISFSNVTLSHDIELRSGVEADSDHGSKEQGRPSAARQPQQVTAQPVLSLRVKITLAAFLHKH